MNVQAIDCGGMKRGTYTEPWAVLNNTPKAVSASCQVRRGCATTEVQYSCMIGTSLFDCAMVRLGSIG